MPEVVDLSRSALIARLYITLVFAVAGDNWDVCNFYKSKADEIMQNMNSEDVRKAYDLAQRRLIRLAR